MEIKSEKKRSRRAAFVAGVLVGAFAGAVTTLLLLDDAGDELAGDHEDERARHARERSTARKGSDDDALTN